VFREVTFRCFTPELAAVLAGFANSEYGLIVKGVNLEVAAAPVAMPDGMPMTYAPVPVPVPSGGESLQSRYRVGGEGSRYGARGGPAGPAYPQSQPQPMPLPLMATAPARTGLQPFLSEKQIKVTLLLHVVKLTPQT